MNVSLTRSAEKQLARLNEPLKTQVLNAIKDIGKDPPKGDIVKLSGRNGYRCRKNDYRLLFDYVNGEIEIQEITTRGHAYKNRR